ncbi:uncharacterized protein LOC121870227 [Homarus americanus]|uniref:uncharacterized protein LOC121870227 n=1 Tax=Homarus americanus TaxID=6706 RepID=UPI001C45A919|nr:uncharacterized protein LOC121870227 [Homarus americanus]
MQDLRSSPYAILQQECVSVLDPHLSFDMDLLAATLGGSPNTLCYDGEGGTFCKDSGHAASGMAAVSGLGEDWVTGHLGEDGVTGHLGEDGVTGHLGEDGVTGHLGEDGVTGHLGEDWVTGHLAAAWPEDDYLSLGTTDPSLVLRTQDMEQSWLDDHLMLLSQDQLLNPETSQLYENHEELPQNHSFNPETSQLYENPKVLSQDQLLNPETSQLYENSEVLFHDQFLNPETFQLYDNSLTVCQSHSLESDYPCTTHQDTTSLSSSPLLHNITSSSAGDYGVSSILKPGTSQHTNTSRKGYRHRHTRVFLDNEAEKIQRTRTLMKRRKYNAPER